MSNNQEPSLEFQLWYDLQPDGRLSPWEVFQAGMQHAIKQGHACKFALDAGGNVYRRYSEPQCTQEATQ